MVLNSLQVINSISLIMLLNNIWPFYNNENLPKWVLYFAMCYKILQNGKSLNFAKVAKFNQIWSHCLYFGDCSEEWITVKRGTNFWRNFRFESFHRLQKPNFVQTIFLFRLGTFFVGSRDQRFYPFKLEKGKTTT